MGCVGGVRGRQLGILVRHQCLVMRRRKVLLACQILAPWLAVLCVLALTSRIQNAQDESTHPPAIPLGGLEKCTPGRAGKCISMIYYPSNEATHTMAAGIAAKNGWTIGHGLDAGYDYDIWSAESDAQVTEWVLDNQNMTSLVVGFGNASSSYGIYEIWMNSTVYKPQTPGGKFQGLMFDSDRLSVSGLRVMNAVNEAVLAYVTRDTHPGGARLGVASRVFPELGSAGRALKDDNSQAHIAFYYAALMFNFIAMLNDMVQYKQAGVRGMLRLMGVKDSVYLLSWFIPNLFLFTYTAAVIVLLGHALDQPGLRVELRISFLYFFVFVLANVCYAMFVASVFKEVRHSILASMSLVTLGVILGLLGVSGELYIFYPTIIESRLYDFMRYCLQFLPSYNFFVLYSVMYLSSRQLFIDGHYYDGEGFEWESFYVPHESIPRPPIDSVYLLLFNIVFYSVLAWYVDAVSTDKNGRGRNWLFFCSRGYWRSRQVVYTDAVPTREPAIRNAEANPAEDGVDADVHEEANRVRTGRLSSGHNVRVLNMAKAYKPGRCSRTPIKTALRTVSFSTQRGDLLALIGPNGAGKTTLFSILSGLIHSDKGDAYLNGYSVRDDLDGVYESLGVCQQYDVYIGDLTVREHIRLVARLRNVPANLIEGEVQARMDELDLATYADQVVGTLSGGTRRRLSVAMACTGDPAVVLLDEPTSGLDPINRSHMQTMLQAVKQNRSIIMSTHSMEDAELIADRVVILVDGLIKGIGHPLQLKAKYGAGYRIHVKTDDAATVERELRAAESSITVANEEGLLVASVSPAAIESMPALCAAVETSKAAIETWSVHQTTLTDVFMRLIGPTTAAAATNPAPAPPSCCGYRITRAPVNETDDEGANDDEDDGDELVGGEGAEGDTDETADPRVSATARALYGCRAVFYKNVALQSRNKKTNCLIILLTILMFAAVGSFNLTAHADYLESYNGAEVREVCAKRTVWLSNVVNYNVSTPRYLNGATDGCLRAWDLYDKKTGTPVFWYGVGGGAPSINGTHNVTHAASQIYSGGGKSTAAGLSNRRAVYQRANDDEVATPAAAGESAMSWFSINPARGNVPIGWWNNTNGAGMLKNLDIVSTRPSYWVSFVWQNASIDALDKKLIDMQKAIASSELTSSCHDYLTRNQTLCDALAAKLVLPYPFSVLDLITVDPSQMTLNFSAMVGDLQQTNTQGLSDIGYAIYIRQQFTINWRLNPLKRFALDMIYLQNAFVAEFSGTNLFYNPGFRVLPETFASYNRRVPEDYMWVTVLFVLPISASVLLPVFVQALVHEKEKRLTQMMTMMGMRISTYWAVNFLFNYSLYLLLFVIMVIMGNGFSFHFFIRTDPGVYIVLFLLWGLVMCAMAFLFSTLFTNARRAVVVTYIMVLFGLLGSFIINYLVLNPYLFPRSSPPPSIAYVLYPPYAFYRGIFVIILRVGPCCGIGMTSEDIFKGDLGKINGYLLLDTILLMLLAWYFEHVLPRTYGIRQHPCFCFAPLRRFLPSRRKPTDATLLEELVPSSRRRVLPGSAESDSESGHSLVESGSVSEVDLTAFTSKTGENEDVARMRRKVAEKDYPPSTPLVLEGLTKTYAGGKTALKDMSLAIGDGECFCLLGPNGAGKSTLLGLLTGLFPATSGSAFVCGYDIASDISKAYGSVGVCPQDEFHWADLTVREHLLFYARLGGIPPRDLKSHVTHTIRQFRLTAQADQRAASLSRGMTRRLSVAIAFTGLRRVIFLDEPTCGLDPDMAVPICEMIIAAKRNRCLIVNTHAMEEAARIATTVAVLSNGQLLCMGTPDYLRTKFGKGYRMEISTENAGQLSDADTFVRGVCPKAERISSVGSHAIYAVPKENLTLSTVFARMQRGATDAGIIHWSISQSSLDEVFRRVVSHGESTA